MADPLEWPAPTAAPREAKSVSGKADSSVLRDLVRQSLAADYEVLEEIGRGGMAVVFLARERRNGRRVAVKVLRHDLSDDAESRARLALEASLVAGIDHPNVMRLHGTRTLKDGSAALILDYAPGGTLKQRLRAASGTLDRDEIDSILEGIAKALAAVHSLKVVHRDVKPDNVFFGPTGNVLLGDFGIARAPVDENLTHDGATLGTPTYMAPEQLDGKPVGPQADIYAYGLIAYELLGRRQPWAGESLWSIVHKQKSEALPDSAKVLARIGDASRAIALHQCISKDPLGRPTDGQALLEAMGWAGPAKVDSARPYEPPPVGDDHTVRLPSVHPIQPPASFIGNRVGPIDGIGETPSRVWPDTERHMRSEPREPESSLDSLRALFQEVSDAVDAQFNNSEDESQSEAERNMAGALMSRGFTEEKHHDLRQRAHTTEAGRGIVRMAWVFGTIVVVIVVSRLIIYATSDSSKTASQKPTIASTAAGSRAASSAASPRTSQSVVPNPPSDATAPVAQQVPPPVARDASRRGGDSISETKIAGTVPAPGNLTTRLSEKDWREYSSEEESPIYQALSGDKGDYFDAVRIVREDRKLSAAQVAYFIQRIRSGCASDLSRPPCP